MQASTSSCGIKNIKVLAPHDEIKANIQKANALTLTLYWMKIQSEFLLTVMAIFKKPEGKQSHRKVKTNLPSIEKPQWESRTAQIKPPHIECEWAFRTEA